MKPSNETCLVLCGNLSEVIYKYLTSPEWARLKYFRETNPHISIKAIVISPDSRSVELIEHNPYVDNIEWCMPDKELSICDPAQDAIKLLPLEVAKRPEIYLTKEEQEQIEEVKRHKPFILVNPFAEIPEEQIFSETQYEPLIKEILKETNYKIVTTGAHCIKKTNVYNLTNEVSSRMAAALIQEASGFVGARSHYFTLAWLYRIKTIVTIPTALKPQITKQIETVWPRHNQYRIFCFKKPLGHKKIVDIKERIISFLGNSLPYAPKKSKKISVSRRKVYLWLYGGFGDCLLGYLYGNEHKRGSKAWKYLAGIKKTFPDLYTKAIVMSPNEQSSLLAEYNPYIDETVYTTSIGINNIGRKVKAAIANIAQDYINLDNLLTDDIPYGQNYIYLPVKDQVVLNNITEDLKQEFIFLHPFASIEKRRISTYYAYEDFTNWLIELIDRLIETTGKKIVVVGGDYVRKINKEREFVKERFNYQRKGLLNLVNQSNLLIDTHLMLAANLVIGCWSCHVTNRIRMGKAAIPLLSPTIVSNFLKVAQDRNILTKSLKESIVVSDFLTSEIISDIANLASEVLDNGS